MSHWVLMIIPTDAQTKVSSNHRPRQCVLLHGSPWPLLFAQQPLTVSTFRQFLYVIRVRIQATINVFVELAQKHATPVTMGCIISAWAVLTAIVNE